MRSWKELVTCPYKPEHQVSIDRIQKHLVKCSKEHNDSQFEVCLLNASHHIPQQEMASHLRTCPHRKAVEIEFIKGWPVHGKEASLREGSCPRAMRIGRVRLVSTSLTAPTKWR